MRAYKHHGTKSARRGITLVEFMIFIAVIGIVMGLILAMGPGCSDVVYPRQVHGEVAKTASRQSATQRGGMEEKFAIKLVNVTMADAEVKRAAGEGDGSLMVECLSTRCSLLQPGDKVQLECNRQVRWFEPNVVQCKLDKVTPAPEPAASTSAKPQ